MTTATEELRPLAAAVLRHDQLDPSPTNPRKRFDEGRLAELAASMAPPVGILEPLVVRPSLARPGRFEIIAGERRWRAAKIAGIVDVPVVVRTVSDAQVITLQLIENKNREDIHPLEEARAIDQLLKLSKAETPRSIASTIGMSERYVQNRLHYMKLIPDVQKAFADDEITAGHADLIVRLTPEDQRRALAACFATALDFEGVSAEEMRTGEWLYEADSLREGDPGLPRRPNDKPVLRLVSVRELDNWIKGSIRLDVTPGAAETRFFPEIREALEPKPIPGAESVKGLPALLQVSDTYEYHPAKGEVGPPPLTRRDWEPVTGKKKCAFARRAVVVLGKRRAQLLDVCTAKGECQAHWGNTIRQKADLSKPRKKAAWEVRAEKEAAARREKEKLWDGVRDQAVALAKKKLDALKPGPVADQLLYRQLRELAGPMVGVSAKKPTVVAMAKSLLSDILADDVSRTVFEDELAPLGIDLRPLFKAAALASKGITAPLKKVPAKKRRAGAKK